MRLLPRQALDVLDVCTILTLTTIQVVVDHHAQLCVRLIFRCCVQTRLHFHILHVPFVFCMEFNRPLWQRFKLQWHTRRQLSPDDHNSQCVLLLLILRSLVLYKQLGSSVQFVFVLHTMARCKDSCPSPSQATPWGGSWIHVQREGH